MNAQTRTKLNLVATALLGLVVLVEVNYIGSRHYTRSDWTARGLFTLSDRSREALEGLDVVQRGRCRCADPPPSPSSSPRS